MEILLLSVQFKFPAAEHTDQLCFPLEILCIRAGRPVWNPGRSCWQAFKLKRAMDQLPPVGDNIILSVFILLIRNEAIIAWHPLPIWRLDPDDRSAAFLALCHKLFLGRFKTAKVIIVVLIFKRPAGVRRLMISTAPVRPFKNGTFSDLIAIATTNLFHLFFFRPLVPVLTVSAIVRMFL